MLATGLLVVLAAGFWLSSSLEVVVVVVFGVVLVLFVVVVVGVVVVLVMGTLVFVAYVAFFVFALSVLNNSGGSLRLADGGFNAAWFGSGVIAFVVAFGTLVGVFGGAFIVVTVGENVIFVCCGPVGSVLMALWTLVCLDFSPPRGEASLPLLLVGLRLFFCCFLVIVALVASVLKPGAGLLMTS